MDFTQQSREEILHYLLSNKDKQICGRLYESQLDYSHTDILVVIQNLTPKQRNSNLSFYILTIGTLILSSCNNYATEKTYHVPKKIEKDFKYNHKILEKNSPVVSKPSKRDEPKKSKYVIPIIGLVVVNPDSSFEPDPIPHTEFSGLTDSDTMPYQREPFKIAEVMPEFVGGIDSLMNFLKENIQYPEWEKQNDIQGTVYVSVIITKEGKVTKPKILRSVNGSKNFDTEVLRVINLMPDWIPGEIQNKKVDVQFNLPIRFAL